MILGRIFNLTIVRIYLVFQLATRVAISIYGLFSKQVIISDLPAAFLLGFAKDIISLGYILPISSILVLPFYLLVRRSDLVVKLLAVGAYFLAMLMLLFISIAELSFWDEFGNRFNFIAVDYLIYTHEIVGTIRESMPLPEILGVMVIIAGLLTYYSRAYIIGNVTNFSLKDHIMSSTLFCVMTSLYYYTDIQDRSLIKNNFANELAKNGSYEFFIAFYRNSLDYNKFYPTIDRDLALKVVRPLVIQRNQSFLDGISIDRATNQLVRTLDKKDTIVDSVEFVYKEGGAKPISNSRATSDEVGKFKSINYNYNVILVVVESLSAEFMGKFGNKDNITPHLDKLADASIFFDNFYATGTRTVRGLEAITLSVPPIPGSSIIRRPNNANLFNIGTVFKENNYAINFFFGGYSYLDNLLNYFSGNGYQVVDRSDLSKEEVSFSNIWGVADEDILLKALKISNKNYEKGQKFFSLIMTTSNHRPYTFPEGRIDLRSGEGRNSAVKYTDYAIGKFLEEAKKYEWFDDTIFIITADHCASSSGKIDLPINKYHIPLMIYAPKIIKPKIVSNLSSQIDIAPTIFGLLNFGYHSKFYGRDILNDPANRAFISTYQLLGYMRGDRFAILSPNASPQIYKINGSVREMSNDQNFLQEAISFYQIGYDFYTEGMMSNGSR